MKTFKFGYEKDEKDKIKFIDAHTLDDAKEKLQDEVGECDIWSIEISEEFKDYPDFDEIAKEMKFRRENETII
jgi:hypothetical protein